jgi:ABC-type branched-subunit amino acid transport system permease subunit
VEATLIMVGVMSVLAVLALQDHFAGATGAQAESLQVTGEALVSMRQWTFLLGPGLIAGINGLLLGYVMYRARLVPRLIPTIGLIGAPIILMSATATIFGGWEQTSVAGGLCAVPIAVWEFSLGVYLTVKGFKNEPAPIGNGAA